jgi:hypothetical protein
LPVRAESALDVLPFFERHSGVAAPEFRFSPIFRIFQQ